MLSILPRPSIGPLLDATDALRHRPFGLTLDQRFVYPSRAYKTALHEVREALHRREGLIVVTGDVGTGKTMLCRTLLQQLDTPVCVSIVLDPRITADDLLHHLLIDFGILGARSGLQGDAAGTPPRSRVMRALQHFLISLVPLGAYAVLVIDEAQNIDPSVFEQLRLLLNLETEDAKLLQIVLIGQPDLHRLLCQPAMRQLNQRVARRCVLEPLDTRDVRRYIEHRLSIAEQLTLISEIEPAEPGDVTVDPPCRVSFTPSAIRTVAARSAGIPRLVNMLCDGSLEIGCRRGMLTVDARSVRAAARRLPAAASVGSVYRFVALTAAAMVVGFVLAVSYRPSIVDPDNLQAISTGPGALAAVSASRPVLAKRPIEGHLTRADSFNVRVASFRATSKAAALAAELNAAGLPAFSTRQDPESHQVVVGPYLSSEEAIAARQRLSSYGHASSEVFVEPATPPDNPRDQRAVSSPFIAARLQQP